MGGSTAVDAVPKVSSVCRALLPSSEDAFSAVVVDGLSLTSSSVPVTVLVGADFDAAAAFSFTPGRVAMYEHTEHDEIHFE